MSILQPEPCEPWPGGGETGDLIVGVGDGDFGILPVGPDDYALTADSDEETGVRWAKTGVNPVLNLGNVSGVLNLGAVNRDTMVRCVLTGNVTGVTLPAPAATESYAITLRVQQDGVGNRSLVFSPGTVRFWSDVPPSVVGAANTIHLLSLLWDGSSWWAMYAVGNSTGLKP